MTSRRPPTVRRKRTAPAGAPPRPPAPPSKRRLYLHRSVAVITPTRVEIRPALSAAIAPLLMFIAGAGAFVFVMFSALGANFPLWLVAPALLAAVVLLPLAGMGFVYSVVGANVVIDANKNSATWQQGLLGLGVGTRELVPFEKIAQIVVQPVVRADALPGELPSEPVSQWDLVLEKTSGRRLTIATVSVIRPLRREAYARICEVAGEVARISSASVALPDGPPRE